MASIELHRFLNKMQTLTGLIAHLALRPSSSTGNWQIVREWGWSDHPGVVFHDITDCPPQLLVAWHADDDSSDFCRWFLEVPDERYDQDAPIHSLEAIRQEIDQALELKNQNRGKGPSKQILAELDGAVLDLANVIGQLKNHGHGVGFLCPASAYRLSKKRIFLADLGFHWNNRQFSLPPPWLKGDSDYRFQFVWDESPERIQEMLLSSGDEREDLYRHDLRTFARIVAWLMIGPSRHAEWRRLTSGGVPTSDTAPEIRGRPAWRWIIRVLSAPVGSDTMRWDEIIDQLEKYPPSTQFEVAPPPPPTPPRPFPWKPVCAVVLAVVVLLVLQFGKALIPSPPPPCELCENCPSTSALRDPLAKLARLWNEPPQSTDGLNAELSLMENAFNAQLTPSIATREKECLAILARTFDVRLEKHSRKTIQELVGTGREEACPQLRAIQLLTDRFQQLITPYSKEPAKCKELLEWHSQFYSCP